MSTSLSILIRTVIVALTGAGVFNPLFTADDVIAASKGDATIRLDTKGKSSKPHKAGATKPAGKIPAKTNPAITPLKQIQPFAPRLVNRGAKTYLELNRAPEKVSIHAAGRRLKAYSGNGRTRFDITSFIPDAYRNHLAIRIYSAPNDYIEKKFDVSAQLAAQNTRQGLQPQKPKTGDKNRNSMARMSASSPSLLGAAPTIKAATPQVGTGTFGEGLTGTKRMNQPSTIMPGAQRITPSGISKTEPVAAASGLGKTSLFGSKVGSRQGASSRVLGSVPRKPMGDSKIPSAVPMILDEGILFRAPNHTTAMQRRLSELPISYTIMREIDDTVPVIVTLRNRSDSGFSMEVERTTAGAIRGTREIGWTIPLSVTPGSRYYVHAEAGEYSGESNLFSIEEVTIAEHERNRGIEVTLSPDRAHYLPGETATVLSRFTEDVPATSSLVVYLARNEDDLSRLSYWVSLVDTSVGAGTYNAETRQWSIPVTIPADEHFQHGRWVMTAVGSSSVYGRSRQFSIGAITDGGGDEPGDGIGMIYPRGGERLIGDHTHVIQWYCLGGSEPPNTSIELHKAGRGLHTWRINREDIHFDSSSRICGATITLRGLRGHETFYFDHDSDYSIVVSGGGHEDESGAFTIGGPLIIEGPFLGETAGPLETLYWGRAYFVRWRSLVAGDREITASLYSDAHEGGARIRPLGSARLSETRLYFDVPAENSTNNHVALRVGGAPAVMSRQFAISPPHLEITVPAGGEHYRHDDMVSIRWSAEHLARRPSLSVYLEGLDGSECIVRNVPASLGTFRWRVSRPTCNDYTDTGSPEAADRSYGTGTMGGLPADIAPGNYRISLRLNVGEHRVFSRRFRVNVD